MAFITIDESNIAQEHICCAIGNDRENKARAQTKKDWLLHEFNNGLVFRRLDQRGKVFIEYMPIESVWKPVIGENYLVINCLWVSGQFKGKGYGKQLLDACISDAKEQKKDGAAVISSDKVKPFLTEKKFYLKQGFEVVDTAKPYFELLALKLKKSAESPHFTEKAKLGECDNKEGFTFIYSNQCPFMEEYVHLFQEIATSEKIATKIIKLKNADDARAQGSPFGTLGVYYNGTFITHELMTGEKFRQLIKDKCAEQAHDILRI